MLPFDKTATIYKSSHKTVPWSHCPDKHLRSGDNVMLRNDKTQGYLVMDLNTRQLGVEESYQLTTTKKNPGPVTRSMFVLRRAEKVDIFGSDDIIRYGSKIKIEANPYVFKKKLWITSMPLGPQVYSSGSRHQEASVNAGEQYNGTWIIDAIDPNSRFERQGEPVKVGEPVLIRHCQTGHYLASDDVAIKSDFGSECEVMCHSFAKANKTQNLALEKKGALTSDIGTRF